MRHSYGPDIRSHYLLIFVREGRAVLEGRSGRIPFGEGDLLSIFPGERVRYTADAAQPWSAIWLGIGGEAVDAYMDKLDISKEKPVLTPRRRAEADDILERIYESAGAPGLAARTQCISLLYAFFALLLDGIGRPHDDYAAAAAEIIAGGYERALTVEELARSLHITPAYLSRVFRARYGMSPKAYILEKKLERACRLLSETADPIGTVSASVGIGDALYFSRLFRRKTGMTPQRYRVAGRAAGNSSRGVGSADSKV